MNEYQSVGGSGILCLHFKHHTNANVMHRIQNQKLTKNSNSILQEIDAVEHAKLDCEDLLPMSNDEFGSANQQLL